MARIVHWSRLRWVSVLALLALASSMLITPNGQFAYAAPAPRISIFGSDIRSYPAASYGSLVTKATEANLSWARYGGIRWDAIEPNPGTDWATPAVTQIVNQHIAQVQQLINSGLRPVINVGATPAWAHTAHPGPDCMAPDNLANITEFMKKLVRAFRLAGITGQYWNIWNEPDICVTGVDTKAGGQSYGSMLQAAAQGVKYVDANPALNADPTAKVVMAGLALISKPASLSENFLAGVLSTAGTSIDVVDFHSYANWSTSSPDWSDTHWPASEGDVLRSKLKFVRDVLQANGYNNTPIIVGEAALRPGTDTSTFLDDQANYLVRLYSRVWANKFDVGNKNELYGAEWYSMGLGNFDNPPSTDLLDSSLNPRPAYNTLATHVFGKINQSQNGVYAGNFSSSDNFASSAYESYRFCNGSTEYQVYWRNDTGTTPLGLPTGVSVYNYNGNATSAQMTSKPILVQRNLTYACLPSRPGNTRMFDDAVIRPVYSGTTQVAMRQTFYAGGGAYSRDSSDFAGTIWPTTWTPTSYAAAWGGQTNAPPTNVPLDAVVIRPVYSGTTQIAMKQIFYVNGMAYSRQSTDFAGTNWPTTWAAPATYAASWGGQTNAPPTNMPLDAVVIRPVYSGTTQIAMKQIFYVNGMAYSRQSTDFAGTSWPTIWAAPATYAASWGNDLNHPPTDRLDGVVIRPVYSGTTRTAMRQMLFSGEGIWFRDSADAAGTPDPTGTLWPTHWKATTAGLSWGTDMYRPPIVSP